MLVVKETLAMLMVKKVHACSKKHYSYNNYDRGRTENKTIMHILVVECVHVLAVVVKEKECTQHNYNCR